MKARHLLKRERWSWRRCGRCSAVGVTLLLLPKCVGCALTYFALAGAAGVEWCGRSEGSASTLAFAIVILALALAAGGALLHARRRIRTR